MKSVKLFRVQDCTRHFVEWFNTHKQARERALEMVGLLDNEPLADIVDIFECHVSRDKGHILFCLNHGGWHGIDEKVDEVNQDGFADIKDWTKKE